MFGNQKLKKRADCRALYNHMSVPVEIKFLSAKARRPSKSILTDVGFDLYSIEDKIIRPLSRENIHCGISVSVPVGHYITIEGRSGLYMKGISPIRGIIDATYTGEIRVVLMNLFDKPYKVKMHDRIAQMILHECAYNYVFKKVKKFSPDHDIRGQRGFGSTGR